MNIGKEIKNLRRSKDLTQEQLAEYLNVSVSAVSQWESGKTIPDISLVLSLANFFSVTLDELFGRSDIRKEQEFEQYRKKNAEYGSSGEIFKQIALWREAVQKYPGNFECLINLAGSLEETFYCGGEIKDIEENAKECVAICERIVRDCTEAGIREQAIKILVYAYCEKNLSLANEEKAVEYANMAGSMFNTREQLLECAYFTEESKEKRLTQKDKNTLNYMDMLTMNLFYYGNTNPEEKIEWCNTALKLWETLIYDGNYLFFHCRIEKIYKSLAMAWAELKNEEETVKALKMVLYHAERADGLPIGELRYTSKFVSHATEDPSTFGKNYTDSDTELFYRFINLRAFDFLCENTDFQSLSKRN